MCLLQCIPVMAKTKEGEAAKKAAAEAAAKPPDEPPAPPPTPIEQLRANTELLEKAVRAKETRVLSGRLLRQTAAVPQAAGRGGAGRVCAGGAAGCAALARRAAGAPEQGAQLGIIASNEVVSISHAFVFAIVCLCCAPSALMGQVTQAYAFDWMP